MHNHEEILSELGVRLGLGLTFDDNRQCLLVLNQELMVSIRHASSTWLFYGLIDDEIEWKDKSYWQNALAINLDLAESGDGSISFELESGVLMYVHCLNDRFMDGSSVYAFLEQFIDRLEAIRKHSLFQE